MSKPKVCIMVPIEDDLRAQIDAVCETTEIPYASSREEQLAAVKEMDGVLLTPRVRADDEFFRAGPNLKVISTTSVGYDPFDIPAATKHGVAVCHTPGVLTDAVANLTMAMILALAQKLFEHEPYVRGGGWARREKPPALGMDVQGRTLGIVGFGRIGQEVTRRIQAGTGFPGHGRSEPKIVAAYG